MKKIVVFFLSLFIAYSAWGQNSSSSNPKDAEAQFQFGRSLIQNRVRSWDADKGNRTEQTDVEKGLYWLKKAAEQGHVRAKTSIGELYYLGIGLNKNYHEAYKWLLMGAEGGDAKAQETLGVMYMFGLGVRQNEEKAVYWYTKAANPDNPSGYYYLGTVYATGAGGVPRDFLKAKAYFGIGCDAGIQQSCHEYARLN